MTTRAAAIRELATGGAPDAREHDGERVSLAKLAMWVAGAGAGGLLLRRLLRRRDRIDVGFVSDEWIAQHRHEPADHFTS